MHEARSAMAHAIEDGRDGAAERSQRSIPALIPVSGPGPVARSTLRSALFHGLAVAVSSLVVYAVVTGLLPRAYSISGADDQLGGLWAVIATLFTFRSTYQQSVAAARSSIPSR